MSRLIEITDPGPSRDGLLALGTDLESLGVEVPRWAEFTDRVLSLPSLAMPERPASLLGATDAELLEFVRETALWRLVDDRQKQTMGELSMALCTEYAGLLRTHADAIVDQLRPDFTAGLAAARKLRALGVTAKDSPATLITREPATIAAWNEFRAVTAPALEQIADARIDLTRVCDVPPRRPFDQVGRRDFGLCFGVAGYDQPGEEPWQRWVRLAPAAQLPPPTGITPLAQLEHSNLIDSTMLAAVAADRHRQRTQTH